MITSEQFRDAERLAAVAINHKRKLNLLIIRTGRSPILLIDKEDKK